MLNDALHNQVVGNQVKNGNEGHLLDSKRDYCDDGDGGVKVYQHAADDGQGSFGGQINEPGQWIEHEIQVIQPAGPLKNGNQQRKGDDNFAHPDKTAPPFINAFEETVFQSGANGGHFDGYYYSLLGLFLHLANLSP